MGVAGACLSTGNRDRGIVNFASDWTKYLAHGRRHPDIQKKIAFELNGPIHYAVNKPHYMLGKDVVKKRQLEAMGWKVIHVSYNDNIWHLFVMISPPFAAALTMLRYSSQLLFDPQLSTIN